MKNLIEEAAKRLRELEQAGIQPPASEEAVRPAQARVRERPSAGALGSRREPFLSDDKAAAANVRVVDLARLEAAGFITPRTSDSKLSHEFRVIKRPLIQNALGRGRVPVSNGNLIMVTSALPGEGKSFVSLNLAISIAMEVDCRVLLVDADVVHPSIPKLLGIAGGKGLLDLLTESAVRFGDALLKTNVPQLSVVLAGEPRRDASELLASQAMRELLREISSRYPDRIVVFDSPPLLATTESRVLASHMGQVLLVVEADRTTHSALESALATVESCPVVLTMLNKAPESEAGSYYDYYRHGQ